MQLSCPGYLFGARGSLALPGWCVTYTDLAFLRREVLRALAHGRLHPGPGEDPAECAAGARYGPSIYTVNEQSLGEEVRCSMYGRFIYIYH